MRPNTMGGTMGVFGAQEPSADMLLARGVADEADGFYGYYTIHVLDDGQIDGMPSINGYDGQVWYHSWHGQFTGMLELHEC